MWNTRNTAMLVIGMQNDHLSKRSPIMRTIEHPERIQDFKRRMLRLISHVAGRNVLMANLPILFQKGYPEIAREFGMLEVIKRNNLFQQETDGADLIPELKPWLNEMTTLSGLTGFNAFVDTGLHDYLEARQIRYLIITGCCMAGCIDSTARSAYELGYKLLIAEDCTLGRTQAEQEMYSQNVFPLYSKVIKSNNLLASLLNTSHLITSEDTETLHTIPAVKAS